MIRMQIWVNTFYSLPSKKCIGKWLDHDFDMPKTFFNNSKSTYHFSGFQISNNVIIWNSLDFYVSQVKSRQVPNMQTHCNCHAIQYTYWCNSKLLDINLLEERMILILNSLGVSLVWCSGALDVPFSTIAFYCWNIV